MMWFFAILVVLLLGGIAAVASGWGRPLAQAYDDRPDATLGTGEPVADTSSVRPMRGADLRGVRFPLAVRGYRMAEVDALLDRLADQLDDRPHDRTDDRTDDRPDDGSDDEPDEPRHRPGDAGGADR